MESLRIFFKYMNVGMLWLWRLGLGPLLSVWPPVFGRYLVITHTGRKSGLPRRTPVNYTLIDGEIYVTAGFGRRADWVQNTRVNPKVELWLPDGWWDGVMEDVTGQEGHAARMRRVLIDSGFATPLFAGFSPHTASDAEIAQATADYRIFHIRRSTARTGPGGPGEYAWVWPILTFLLLWGRRRGKQ
ncbi:MAG: nitroreductase family deazaflavin-dependent oxidoreductase [Chloroflexi bacterium]|nr:MAG: nitroreductase family deazaflavin-dependent oxidoreductase [Chloroflexota bacterium]